MSTSAAARVPSSELPERVLRSLLLSASHQRWLGTLATRLPVTRSMVGRFVAGESLPEALDAVAGLNGAGYGTTLDVLGESVTSPADADAAVARYLAALDALEGRDLVRNVSLKLSQMGLGIDRALCRENVERIFRRAAEVGAFVRIDMEDHTTTDATLALHRELRAVNPSSGVVIQAALRRSASDVAALNAERIPVRLCKGAYKEPASVAYTDKPDVDRNYAALLESLLLEGAHPALATHDDRMIARALQVAKANGIGAERFEFQMLFGVRRDLQERLLAEGWAVRVYVPFGTQWYPYFMRRLAERPANVTFLLRSVMREGSAGGASRGRSR